MALYKLQGKEEKLKGIHYEFDNEDRPLGEGGMGKVFKGCCVNETSGHKRDVAVKFLYEDLPASAIEKARREASMQFHHSNLLEMLGFFETETRNQLGEAVSHFHVVSELLIGVSLDKLLEGKTADQWGNAVPYAEKLYKDYQQDSEHFAIGLIKNILSGLMYMHDGGYIHRDIDPSNIMVTADGHVKLIDFGIGKKMNALTTSDKHLTKVGEFLGKPEYAAPELILGFVDEQNQATDIYAVGILLFQLIVGHLPFEGDRSDIMQAQRFKPMPLKLVKNKDLRRVIEKATSKKRSDRYQSAAEFRVAIDNITKTSTSTPSLPWKKIAIGGAGALAAVALAVALMGPILPPPPPPDEETKEEETEVVVQAYSYTCEDALRELKENPANPIPIQKLDSLSSNGVAEASYLLSQFYFKSKDYARGDECRDPQIVDIVKAVQKELKHNNIKAHSLLKKATSQDPTFYKAYYELGRDYFGASYRTEAVPNQNLEESEKCMENALKYATQNNDQVYCKFAQDALKVIKRHH